MATNLKNVCQMLFDEEIRFMHKEERNEAALRAETRNYVNAEGQKMALIVISLVDEGEYIEVHSPAAYKVDAEKAPLFLQACAMIQWRTRLIQFEYDPNDGEVRPKIEFPLEDAPLTRKQLMRCINGLIFLIDTYHPVLQRVLDEGVIEFEEKPEGMPDIPDLLDALPLEVLEAAIARRKQLPSDPLQN